MKSILIAIVVVGAVILGCVAFRKTIDDKLPQAVIRVLRSPESVDLLTLNPVPLEEHAPGTPGLPVEREFHGYEILGHAPLTTREQREKLTLLLFQGIVESDGRVAGCFNPRHGVRAVRDGEVVDLVICYECLQIKIHAVAPKDSKLVLTSQAVEPRVTKLYESVGLQLAPR